MSAESPIDVVCRHCEAPIGETCTSKPQDASRYVIVLRYFHSVRWRDFNRARSEQAAMADWNKKYSKEPTA